MLCPKQCLDQLLMDPYFGEPKTGDLSSIYEVMMPSSRTPKMLADCADIMIDNRMVG